MTKIAEGLTSESYTTAVLENNTRYYWRVVAKDPFGGETASVVYQFQSRNEVPSVPLLQSPASQAYVSSPVTTLSWTDSNDPEGGEVTYEVYLGTDLITQKRIGIVYNTLAFTTSSLIENTTYYWKVVARDNYGGVTESAIWNFTYQSTAANLPPTVPVLHAPEDQSMELNRDVTVSWHAAGDPEGGDITYAVYLSEDSGAGTLITSGLVSTHYTLYNLDAGKRFYWKVVANDDAGNSSTSATWQFSTVNTYTISGTIADDQGQPLEGVRLHGFSSPCLRMLTEIMTRTYFRAGQDRLYRRLRNTILYRRKLIFRPYRIISSDKILQAYIQGVILFQVLFRTFSTAR